MLDLSDYKEPRQKSELQFTTALPQGQYRASQWLKTKQHSAQLLPGEELDHTSKISTLCVCVGGIQEIGCYLTCPGALTGCDIH